MMKKYPGVIRDKLKGYQTLPIDMVTVNSSIMGTVFVTGREGMNFAAWLKDPNCISRSDLMNLKTLVIMKGVAVCREKRKE